MDAEEAHVYYRGTSDHESARLMLQIIESPRYKLIFCRINPVETGVGLTLTKYHIENQTRRFKGIGCFRVMVEVCFPVLTAADNPRMFNLSRSDFLRAIHLVLECTQRKIHFIPV